MLSFRARNIKLISVKFGSTTAHESELMLSNVRGHLFAIRVRGTCRSGFLCNLFDTFAEFLFLIRSPGRNLRWIWLWPPYSLRCRVDNPTSLTISSDDGQCGRCACQVHVRHNQISIHSLSFDGRYIRLLSFIAMRLRVSALRCAPSSSSSGSRTLHIPPANGADSIRSLIGSTSSFLFFLQQLYNSAHNSCAGNWVRVCVCRSRVF